MSSPNHSVQVSFSSFIYYKPYKTLLRTGTTFFLQIIFISIKLQKFILTLPFAGSTVRVLSAVVCWSCVRFTGYCTWSTNFYMPNPEVNLQWTLPASAWSSERLFQHSLCYCIYLYPLFLVFSVYLLSNTCILLTQYTLHSHIIITLLFHSYNLKYVISIVT